MGGGAERGGGGCVSGPAAAIAGRAIATDPRAVENVGALTPAPVAATGGKLCGRQEKSEPEHALQHDSHSLNRNRAVPNQPSQSSCGAAGVFTAEFGVLSRSFSREASCASVPARPVDKGNGVVCPSWEICAAKRRTPNGL